ncbi:MAG: hypothetical protein GX595_11155 [Lentisphaerae bacterium]|nr:hypothetical protein [Lentisphaerota bacterium]
MATRCASLLIAAFAATSLATAAEPVMVLDFRGADHGWVGNAHVRSVAATPEGLAYVCSDDEDPWLEGPPPERLPTGTSFRLILRLKAEGGDRGGEVFYGRNFRSGDSVRFTITDDGQWHDYELLLPPLPPGSRLRLDPGSQGGRGVVESLRAVVLEPLTPITFTPPGAPSEALPWVVESGDVVVRHSGALWNGFRLEVGGKAMAAGLGEARIGYRTAAGTGFLEIGPGDTQARQVDGALELKARRRDADGVAWQLTRRFEPGTGTATGSIRVSTRVEVERDREVFHLPWLTLFPGFRTFGERKTQALLPGVEYLDDEPSSSEADVRGPKAARHLVDDLKLCFPLMALCHEGRYLGVTWDRAERPAAVFDSPDRIFLSGAHLMALWYPGVGPCREEAMLSPLDSVTLAAGVPLEFAFTLLGGPGETVVPAVQHWLRLRPLPAPPEFPGGLEAARHLLARGWVDSAAYHDGLWRHAVWGESFLPQRAADAAAFMRWLSGQSGDAALDDRLAGAVEAGLREVGGRWHDAVSHVPLAPLPALVFGDIQADLERRLGEARERLRAMPADGVVRYERREGGPDCASTHTANHANGLAAAALVGLAEVACWSGDASVAAEVIALVDRQTALYGGGVPRGAQTWEMPLHTPDILASARLVRLYTLAYALSGEPRHLAQARYWAWTGVPFVYLDPPVDAPVGLYATIAVLGATHWHAPFWIGLPVQWCGLVYRSALLDLARLDGEHAATWERLATGITRAGLQMTFPLDDAERRGLLPDFFHLRAQRPDGPAINPGTVQAGLPEAYGQAPLLDFRVVGPRRWRVLAPGRVTPLEDMPPGGIRLRVEPWPTTPCDVHLAGVQKAPSAITWTGAEPATHRHHAALGCLTVRLRGPGELTVIE